MKFESKYDLGQIVYLKTDIDQRERIITQIKFDPTGCIYKLALCTEETYHFDIEISTQRNIIKALGLNEN